MGANQSDLRPVSIEEIEEMVARYEELVASNDNDEFTLELIRSTIQYKMRQLENIIAEKPGRLVPNS